MDCSMSSNQQILFVSILMIYITFLYGSNMAQTVILIVSLVLFVFFYFILFFHFQ